MNLFEVVAGAPVPMSDADRAEHHAAMQQHKAIIDHPNTTVAQKQASKSAIEKHQALIDNNVGERTHKIPEHIKPMLHDIKNGMSYVDAGLKHGVTPQLARHKYMWHTDKLFRLTHKLYIKKYQDRDYVKTKKEKEKFVTPIRHTTGNKAFVGKI